MGSLLNENFNFLKTGLNSHILHVGSYSLKTNKDFEIQNVNFTSEESIYKF